MASVLSPHRIALRFVVDPRVISLRELSGAVERSVSDTGTRSAIELLEALADGPRDFVRKLPTADRDRLLAAIYQRTWGDRIEGTLYCRKCQKPFDLSFSLSHLIASLDESANSFAVEKLADGTFGLPDGTRFRLPMGEDELAIEGLSPNEAEETLFHRCIVDSSKLPNRLSFQEILEQLAPILDFDLDANCPECNQGQKVPFNLQAYLLQSLIDERKRLIYEIHQLAVSYGWNLEEILSLRRSERKEFIRWIEADRSSRVGPL